MPGPLRPIAYAEPDIVRRDAPGGGFTHKYGDIVTIAAPELGSLVNRMKRTDERAPWTYGASHLMRHLAGRGLL